LTRTLDAIGQKGFYWELDQFSARSAEFSAAGGNSPRSNAELAPECRQKVRHRICLSVGERTREGVMTHTFGGRRFFGEVTGLLEHFAVVGLGFVLMVVGLGLGVTMIMLPVGIVLGLMGAGLFVAGIFGHLDSH
jgi:hypothetical protein